MFRKRKAIEDLCVYLYKPIANNVSLTKYNKL